VVSVGFLRTCFSDVYGSHIPRYLLYVEKPPLPVQDVCCHDVVLRCEFTTRRLGRHVCLSPTLLAVRPHRHAYSLGLCLLLLRERRAGFQTRSRSRRQWDATLCTLPVQTRPSLQPDWQSCVSQVLDSFGVYAPGRNLTNHCKKLRIGGVPSLKRFLLDKLSSSVWNLGVLVFVSHLPRANVLTCDLAVRGVLTGDPCLAERMFRDLLLDVSQAFLAAAAAENTVHEAAAGFEEHATPPNPVDVSGGSSCGGWSGDGGSGPSRRSGRSGTARAPALVFHVTEYDVTRLRFPPKWENHAGECVRSTNRQTFVVEVDTTCGNNEFALECWASWVTLHGKAFDAAQESAVRVSIPWFLATPVCFLLTVVPYTTSQCRRELAN